MLRDWLVCRIEDSAIQKRLLFERMLDFQKALDIAVSMEATSRDVKSMGVHSICQPISVHKMSLHD